MKVRRTQNPPLRQMPHTKKQVLIACALSSAILAVTIRFFTSSRKVDESLSVEMIAEETKKVWACAENGYLNDWFKGKGSSINALREWTLRMDRSNQKLQNRQLSKEQHSKLQLQRNEEEFVVDCLVYEVFTQHVQNCLEDYPANFQTQIFGSYKEQRQPKGCQSIRNLLESSTTS